LNVLILACDGVWDVLSNEMILSILKNYYEDKNNSSLMGSSAMIKDIAFQLDSGDNMTVMVVDITELLKMN